MIWEHVNPYGRYELDMESHLAIKVSQWVWTRYGRSPCCFVPIYWNLGSLRSVPMYFRMSPLSGRGFFKMKFDHSFSNALLQLE
jgi:hypothetical protein